MNRLSRFAALVVAFVATSLSSGAIADDGDMPDPWPLPTSVPSGGAEEARSTFDAIDARRAAESRAGIAPMLDDVVDAERSSTASRTSGRSIVMPMDALRGLRRAAKSGQNADSRTVPEVMNVLAGVGFDGGIAVPDFHVLPGADGKIDRVLKGEFRPASIDDRPYVLRPRQLLRPSVVPPPPLPRTQPEAAGNKLVRGVRIEVDEDLLRRAFAAPGARPEGEVLASFERSLFAAPSGDAAVRLLADFARLQKQAVVDARVSDRTFALVQVSLASLLAEETRAPDAGRLLGGLTRLLGVAVDVAAPGSAKRADHAGDVLLLGEVVAGQPKIPLEALSLALRYVWREGRVPGCSLDPDPKNPAGAQHVRLFGIAEDSAFARIMLDADYAMKRLIGAAPGAPRIEGFVDMRAALVEEGYSGTSGTVHNRFWLTPAQPGPGDVLMWADGAAALFEARVVVRTEEMREDYALGRGRSSPSSARVARSLTERYDEIAAVVPSFGELRGLFDVVYAAQVLRFLAPSHPVLEQAAARPHVSVVVPATYAGIRVVHPTQGGTLVLEGGCEAGARLSAGAMLDGQHPAFRGLVSSRPANELVPRFVATGSAGKSAEALLSAQAALAGERHDEAEDLATEALDADGENLAALALRAVARVRAGRAAGGLLDALEASRRAPHEPLYEANLRALLVELGDEHALAGMSAPAAEVLHAGYLAEAATAGVQREWAAATQAAERALRARPSSVEAMLLHATLRWLVGDLASARRLAWDAASLAPEAADVHALLGWVSSMEGDRVGARAAFDRAVELKPSADVLGSRAVLRLLAGDVAGAGQDALAAMQLDAGDWGTQAALQALRRAACLGLAPAQVELGAQMRLPSEAQLALYEAQQTLALGQDSAAAEAYERALAALSSGNVNPDVLVASRAREFTSLMLARCLGVGRPGDPVASERAAGLLSAVEAEHPSWLGPRWMRLVIAQKAGDIPAALEALAACRGGNPAVDPVLLSYVPPSSSCFAAFVSLLECSLPLMVGGRSPAMDAGAVERLEAAFAGSKSAAKAKALAAFFGAVPEGETSEVGRRAQAGMEQAADEAALVGSPPTLPEDVLLDVVLLGGRAAMLAQQPSDEAALVRAVRALARLAPQPDIYEALTTMVAEQRKGAILAAIRRFVMEVDGDPRGRFATQLAEKDPERASKLMEAVVRPARDRAAALGEPMLEHFVDLVLLGLVEGMELAAIDARLSSVRRVLSVAADPHKSAKLRATEAELLARKEAFESALVRRAEVHQAEARALWATPTDAKTHALLQREMNEMAVRKGRDPTPEDPLDVIRQAELQLKASLQALGAPLPAGLK